MITVVKVCYMCRIRIKAHKDEMRVKQKVEATSNDEIEEVYSSLKRLLSAEKESNALRFVCSI